MASSKNPQEAIFVPNEIIAIAAKRPEIVCNLRPNQRPIKENETEEEKRFRQIEEGLFDTWFFYRPLKDFFRGVKPGERLILVCQSFGEDIFTFITDIEKIYWADNHYPRIDFKKRPRIVYNHFGHSNLWGGFLLAVARVGRVKKQARVGYDLLVEIADRPRGLKK